MTSSTCRQCSADVSMTHLDPIEGEEHGIHVTIGHLPILNCTNGHKRFPNPEFPLELVQRLIESPALDGITPAVKKGIFRTHLHCPACGGELAPEPRDTKEKHASLDLPEGEVVEVDVSLPLYRCPECDQEVSEPLTGLQRDVMQAMANAFRNAEIPPG